MDNKKPKPTAQKSSSKFDGLKNLSPGGIGKKSSPAPIDPKTSKAEPKDPRSTPVGQSKTLQATSGITPTEKMRDLLNKMKEIEPEVDDAGYPEPEITTDVVKRVDTENLPAVAGQALLASGVQNPDWHKVANLPGNMSRVIRTLGRKLFGALTRTPTDEIYMIANLAGQGPNSKAEVNAVANWIREHGKSLGAGQIDFDSIMSGYVADTNQFSAAGIRWLLVRDDFGTYIYSWPESDSVEIKNTPALR